MTIKEKLSFCIEHGMAIKYVAERMKVDPSTLSKWLKGQKGITHKNENLLELTLKEIIYEMNEALFGGS